MNVLDIREGLYILTKNVKNILRDRRCRNWRASNCLQGEFVIQDNGGGFFYLSPIDEKYTSNGIPFRINTIGEAFVEGERSSFVDEILANLSPCNDTIESLLKISGLNSWRPSMLLERLVKMGKITVEDVKLAIRIEETAED